MGLEWVLSFYQPGHRLSEQRKMLRRGIGSQHISSHNEKIEQRTAKLMLELSPFEGNPSPLIMGLVPASNRESIAADRNRFSQVARLVIQVAYGKKILETMGKDLLSWNSQLIHLFEGAFVRFWLVDIFNFRASVPS